MKTTETKIPNLDSLVSELNEGKPEKEQKSYEEIIKASDDTATSIKIEPKDDSTLWNEFIDMLELSKDVSVATSQKIYKIDSDIVETLAQCKFKNHSISHVINCILRTYIIANIGNFDGLRKHEPSLFDNYLTK